MLGPCLEKGLLHRVRRDNRNINVGLCSREAEDEIDAIHVVVIVGGYRMLFQEAVDAQAVTGMIMKESYDSIMPSDDTSSLVGPW